MELLQDSKVLQEPYTLLYFNFITIYIIHKISALFKNHLK